ncbi:MAG: AP protein [Candidatus Omnitrophota bacterium]
MVANQFLRFLSGILLFAAFLVFSFSAQSAPLHTKNVILVTVDGLRVQEMFGGADPLLIDNQKKSGIESLDEFKAKYWRDTPEKRREAMLPFLWTELAKQGVILGNQAKNSVVRVKNEHKFSYPGYAEILTGQPQEKIKSNDLVPNPAPTVLDYLKKKLQLGETGIAAFGSWNVFNGIATHEDGSIFINAGYEAMPDRLLTEGMKFLNHIQFQIMSPWDTVRFDAVTGGLALEFLKAYKPRFLYAALGETDDWSHERRYDRYGFAAHYFDGFLQELWTTLQSLDEYRGQTSLVILTDHGRGNTEEDWVDHNAKTPGSENVWISVIGPDSPDKGELSNTKPYYYSSAAATIVKLFGFDYKEFNPQAEPPIEEAFE